MSALRKIYIWQQTAWPDLHFSAMAVAEALKDARREQALIEGKALAIGLDRAGDVVRELFTQEVIATAAIEDVGVSMKGCKRGDGLKRGEFEAVLGARGIGVVGPSEPHSIECGEHQPSRVAVNEAVGVLAQRGLGKAVQRKVAA